MENAFSNKLYKSNKVNLKSGIQKEKENTKTLRQTHDLKIYDELIAKTKANILKFKKEIKERPNLTIPNTTSSIEELNSYKAQKIHKKMLKRKEEFTHDKYSKSLIDSMKKDLSESRKEKETLAKRKTFQIEIKKQQN